MAERSPAQETVEVVKRNWRAEMETAQVYRELAAREADEKRKAILNRMAEAEERHAQRWAKKLADLGEPIPTIPDSILQRDVSQNRARKSHCWDTSEIENFRGNR